jgi:PKHD-type hydroxylase
VLLTLPGILPTAEVARLRALAAAATWSDGRITAGHQSALEKRNLQLAQDAPAARAIADAVLAALAAYPAFTAAALPHRIVPPLVNRYDAGMDFGDHVDNAIRTPPGGPHLRTDVSATLFLSDPDTYEGGGLVIDGNGGAPVRLPAGDLILYPATTIHRVVPVTRGTRFAVFFWVQSLVRDQVRRTLLYDLDAAIVGLRSRGLAGEAEVISLTGLYHNLLRQWAEC